MWLLQWHILFLLIDWVIRVVMTFVIIMRRRPLTVSLTWLAVVLFLPEVGLFFYLLFGEARLGRRRLRVYREVSDGFFIRAIELWNERERAWIPQDQARAPIARFGTAVCGLPPLRGNDLTLIGPADEFLLSLIEDIDHAADHVHILTYIWQHPGAAEAVARALIRAAGRGVECRVLADGVGSRPFFAGRLDNQMRDAGVRVIEALPVGPIRFLFRRLDLRNHRKIAVVDGRIGYCGSHNLTDATFGTRGRDPVGPWIDATMRVEGPAAQALQMVFLRDWAMESEEQLGSIDRYLPRLSDLRDGGAVQVLPSGPGAEPSAISQAMLTAFFSARRELVLTTPYFVPGEGGFGALQAAARRGVDVTIVLPARNDSRLVAAAARSYYLDLLESGVRVMHYRPALLHSKTITVDGELSMIGSANFDTRSFSLNFEATMLVYDADATCALRELQQTYIRDAIELRAEDWRRRPRHRVFLDNAAQMLSPVL
ncbi:MAG: cardiolipin synthase [Phycisphaeraceae bacterium]|nr:cardiolipin synthase [Phycisphaeraceae bacterium]